MEQSGRMRDKTLTVKQAYLVMCEFLFEEGRTNNWQEENLIGLLDELALCDEWESNDPGGVLTFEDMVEKVLSSGSRFDAKILDK